jgi:hypothetical protein
MCTSILAFGAQHSSVPLDHRAYDIISSGQLRGLLSPSMAVKPYAASKTISMLSEMIDSGELTDREQTEIESIISQLRVTYTTENVSDIISQGSYRSYNENLDIGVALGAAVDGQGTVSIPESSHYDVRSSFRGVFSGDITDIASFYMDFGIRADKLDNRVFSDTDFTIPGEGFYLKLSLDGKRLKNIPDDDFFVAGFDFYPELSIQLLDSALQFRWGSIHRDWGVGENNIQLSGTARTFDAFEVHGNLSSWLRYSVIHGSLGIFSLETLDGDEFFSDNLDAREDYRFKTNYSAKRLEVDFTEHVTFGIFESMVWQKRAELGYYNPFAILMFQQNLQGDLDNVLAGIDIQWRLPGLFRLYGTWATTELNELSPARFFKSPRNIMGMQAGVDLDIPWGMFSKMTVQYTRLEPFFYTHYTHTGEFLDPSYRGDPGAEIETAYVNKGENLGYPLHPNSDEFLLRGSTLVTDGWSLFGEVKLQRRSGQYGYEIDLAMNYDEFKDGVYDDKDFAGNIFELTTAATVGASRQFPSLPLRVYTSYQFSMRQDRDRITGDDVYNHTYEDNWNTPEFDHRVQVGFHLFK